MDVKEQVYWRLLETMFLKVIVVSSGGGMGGGMGEL